MFNNYFVLGKISFSLDKRLIGSVSTERGYFRRGRFRGHNPWLNGSRDAPFDQEVYNTTKIQQLVSSSMVSFQFYIGLSLAVGGTNGFFPDDPHKLTKPWRNQDPYPMREFWKRREQWMPTWDLRSTNSSFLIDFIRVYAL